MALPKLALAALGLGAVAAVAVRKPKSKSKTKRPPRRVGGFKAEPSPSQDHPICKKYPSGDWGQGYVNGFPKGNPGWSSEDVAMVRDAVQKAVAAAPPFESMSKARELSFAITRELIRGWCPSLELPQSPMVVENYLKKSLALRWLWTKVDQMVWDAHIGNPGGGN